MQRESPTRPRMCRRAIPRSARKSTSAKRNSPTSALGPSTFSTKKTSTRLACNTPPAAGVVGAVARPWPVAPAAGGAGVVQLAVAEPVELAQAVQVAAAVVAFRGALAASFARKRFFDCAHAPTHRYQDSTGRIAALPVWFHGRRGTVWKFDYRWNLTQRPHRLYAII